MISIFNIKMKCTTAITTTNDENMGGGKKGPKLDSRLMVFDDNLIHELDGCAMGISMKMERRTNGCESESESKMNEFASM